MSESGHLDVPGARLYYELEGDGPPVVLMHAGVANLRMWDPHVPELAERYRVIRYDTRGFGRTANEDVPFSNRADLAAVMDHAGAASATLVGASRSGSIALDFTLERPERVTALVSVAGGIGGWESPAGAQSADLWAEAERMWEAHEWEHLADLESRYWADGPGQPTDRVPALREQVRAWILESYRAEHPEGQPQTLDPPAAGRLGEIHVPTLAIAGELDDPGTTEACRRIGTEVSGARFELFEGAAHMLNLEQPERFTRLLLDFLDEVHADAR